jgi:hypothetical protein
MCICEENALDHCGWLHPALSLHNELAASAECIQNSQIKQGTYFSKTASIKKPPWTGEKEECCLFLVEVAVIVLLMVVVVRPPIVGDNRRD